MSKTAKTTTKETKAPKKLGRPFGTGLKPEERGEPNESITFRLPVSLMERMRGVSFENGRTMANVVREALTMGLDDMDTDPERAKAVRLAIAQKMRPAAKVAGTTSAKSERE